ncbi:MAG: c-type cytochrome [Ramlibacter sp.]|nr:c-type cytochrome [Ramlibacter sp.]
MKHIKHLSGGLVLALLAPAAALAAPGSITTAPAAPAAGPTGQVDVQALLGKNACLSCHGLTQKIVGPGYREVAERYKEDPQAQSKLETSIRAGSAGKWGDAPMPAFAMLRPEEIRALAEFVRQQ